MAEKQWYFDAASPGSVPDELKPVLEEKGIPEDHILLCVKSDLNREMVRCDCWTLATDSDLIVLSGSSALSRRRGMTPLHTKNRLERKFELNSWDVFDLKDLSDYRVRPVHGKDEGRGLDPSRQSLEYV